MRQYSGKRIALLLGGVLILLILAAILLVILYMKTMSGCKC